MNKFRNIKYWCAIGMILPFLCLSQINDHEYLSVLSPEDSLLYYDYKFQVTNYVNPKPDSALFFIKKLKEFSEKLNYGIGLADAEYLMASYQWRMQQYDSATYFYNRCIDQSKLAGYKRGIAVSHSGLCRMNYFQGEMEKAIQECKTCLEVALELGDMAIIPDTYIALGNIAFRQNELKSSLRYFLKADSLHSAKAVRPEIIGAGFQSMARVYQGLEDYDKAEEYYLKANEEYHKLPIDASYFFRTTDWHLGEVYYHEERFIEADSLLTSSHEFFSTINDIAATAEINIYLGRVKLEQEKFKEAEDYLLEGFLMHEKMNNAYESASAALELGKLYINQKAPDKAIAYLERAMVQTRDTTQKISLITKDVLFQLAEAQQLSGNSFQAYNTMKEANRIKDSLNNVQNIAAVLEIEERYQNEKKEQEIALLNSKNDLLEQRRINQRNILLGGLGVTSLIGIFLFYQFRNRQKTNRKLRELDALKSNFFANISHEFRTPLTLISGPLEKKLDSKKITKSDRQEFELMQRNSQKLLGLVDQLLDLSKLESGKYRLRVSSGDLSTLIRAIAESFEFRARQKKIDYKVHVEELKNAWFDKDVIEKVLSNLLSNAFKYTSASGRIGLYAKSTNGHLDLKIENTPAIVSSESIGRMFERFYQGDSHTEGVGIGLSLVKELVVLSKGEIDVSQPLAQTLCFNARFPINRSSYTTQEIGKHDKAIDSHKSRSVYDTKLEDIDGISQEEDDERDIILIVEDNEDVRQLISSTFDGDYRILQAENGETGIQEAIEYIPDLIISDIMMPVTDGLELCEKLKNDERTSHVPIILLTAKAGEEDQYHGLASGADAYVTKPFKIKLLKTRVQKLIESRKALRDRYSQEVILKPKDIAITNLDEQFLERVQEVMEIKLTESAFSIKEFSDAVGMSRMQLHRKLKALTGLSASEFVRSQRLKLAANLLQTSQANVSEIGYQVGFNDPSYFTKCFKEAYGVSPSEYTQNSIS